MAAVTLCDSRRCDLPLEALSPGRRGLCPHVDRVGLALAGATDPAEVRQGVRRRAVRISGLDCRDRDVEQRRGRADTVHVPDDRVVNKHYDLTGMADLAVLLDELTALLLGDEVPTAAAAFHAPDGGPQPNGRLASARAATSRRRSARCGHARNVRGGALRRQASR
jgi:hypothetical protein